MLLLGSILLRKLKDAIHASAEHRAALQELEHALVHDEPKAFAEWKEEVHAWEADPSKTNPFDPKVESTRCIMHHAGLSTYTSPSPHTGHHPPPACEG